MSKTIFKRSLSVSLFLLALLLVSSCVSRSAKEQVDSVIDKVTVPKQDTSNDGQQQTIPPEPSPLPASCEVPTGFFSIVYVRQKQIESDVLDVAGVFKYTGNCEADVYLEAGIGSSPSPSIFSFLPSEFQTKPTGLPSNCDGNIHYNGAVYHVKPSDDIKFRFQPKGYGGSGTYNVIVGAYAGGTKTGCLKYGGYTIHELYSKASFSNTYDTFESLQSYAIIS